MAVKTLTIDGHATSADEDRTILEAAADAGIRIPTLCHLDGLSDVAACRLCLVEIAGNARLLPACSTRVTEGMEVGTDTERLRGHRRILVELLFAERNHVCSVCVANGHCDLQDLATSLGILHVRFPSQHPALRLDASHPRFLLDHDRCVLCTRCVRVCDEIEGAHSWDIEGRGAASRVIIDLDQPWGESETCTGCGKCVHVCPTAALIPKDGPGSRSGKRPDIPSLLRRNREEPP